MPYRVQSHCADCADPDTFIIGHWTMHLGVHVCPRAQSIVNVPVDTGQCPGCGTPQFTPLSAQRLMTARGVGNSCRH